MQPVGNIRRRKYCTIIFEHEILNNKWQHHQQQLGLPYLWFTVLFSGWCNDVSMALRFPPNIDYQNDASRLTQKLWLDTGQGRLIYRFCPEKRPWDVSPGPLPPSLRNVKLQNDPLIVVSIAVSRANGPKPGHAPSRHSRERRWGLSVINTYGAFFRCSYDIFFTFLFNSWLEKIYKFHFNRNVKQQTPPSPETFLRLKSTNEPSVILNFKQGRYLHNSLWAFWKTRILEV